MHPLKKRLHAKIDVPDTRGSTHAMTGGEVQAFLTRSSPLSLLKSLSEGASQQAVKHERRERGKVGRKGGRWEGGREKRRERKERRNRGCLWAGGEGSQDSQEEKEAGVCICLFNMKKSLGE